ncbi:MAG: GDSL-type esterase/lipase family protein [Rhodomicrobium sp.]
MRVVTVACLALISALLPLAAKAQQQNADKWVTAWAASVQGPYPVGNAILQPDLHRVFPSPGTGAKDQSFRLIVGPDIWGREARIRLSNVFGTKPVTFDGIFIGLQLASSAVAAGTNRPVTFGGSQSIAIEPGQSAWSDAVPLPFVADARPIDLQGRKLAVSFHIAGESGPMTWHAKGLTTSYITVPGAGAPGAKEDEAGFPYATTSWYFLDALDMKAAPETQAIVAFGDSLTDGTGSTLNGGDRWPDVLSRRLHAQFAGRFAVVNAGIGGNLITGPAEYSPQMPYPGGPAALQRLDRDVLSLSGVSAVIWFEGINDFSKNGNVSVEAAKEALSDGVAAIKKRLPGVRVVGATITTALGNVGPAHGFAEQETKRQALNDFIRGSGLFNGVIDFDKATVNTETGELQPEFVPDSTTGGQGDKLHPNRLGYLTMGQAIDLSLFATPPSQSLSAFDGIKSGL